MFDSQKILNYKCSFYRANAGSSDSLRFEKEERQNAEAFEEMFTDWDPAHYRGQLGLGCNETTNPQAEVMVFDAIPISCISRIVFQSEYQLKNYNRILATYGIHGTCEEYLFLPRRDYKYWKKIS